MSILGLHHVTAITANAAQNLQFYTQVLGLRLVKKTVNQDDVSAYHLFYADKIGSPGTDITFFDWPQSGPRQAGTDAITTTFFRVNNEHSLHYWLERFELFKVNHLPIEPLGPHTLLRFTDPEGQELGLIVDHNARFNGEIWDKGPVPAEHAIRGFYAVRLAVTNRRMVEPVLVDLLGWSIMREFNDVIATGAKVAVYGIDGGGPGKEVHVVEVGGEPSWNSSGTVHHVAFRVENQQALVSWNQKLDQAGLPNSGIVDRFYFKSLYFRISPGILFELATDGPGFVTDETLDNLGESLALPPFLEQHRKMIEAGLSPLVTDTL